MLLIVTEAYPCSWPVGYFYQVSALRGNVVGANLGLLQDLRWLRHSFPRKNARLTLYDYRHLLQRSELRLVKITKTDVNGYFDFGEITPGLYTLVIDDNELGDQWFDVEIKQQAKQTRSVTIDVSPVFPDCTGGHEFIQVRRHFLRCLS